MLVKETLWRHKWYKDIDPVSRLSWYKKPYFKPFLKFMSDTKSELYQFFLRNLPVLYCRHMCIWESNVYSVCKNAHRTSVPCAKSLYANIVGYLQKKTIISLDWCCQGYFKINNNLLDVLRNLGWIGLIRSRTTRMTDDGWRRKEIKAQIHM